MNDGQPSRSRRWIIAVAALAFVAAALASCVGTDTGGGAANNGTREASEPQEKSSSPSPPNSANPLWGTWSAPCDRIMNALVGESFEEMTCTGSYVINFKPDGSFIQTAGGTQTVRSPDGEFSQTLPWSANYTATYSTDGDQMRIGGNASAPVSITPDEVDESGNAMVASLTNTGMFPFSLSENTLTLQPRFPEIGQVTLVYSRQ